MFDDRKFMKEKFEMRTEAVPVPDLAAYFPEGEPAIWTVRGLTGQELARANDAAERNKNVVAIIEGLMSQDAKSKTEAVKGLIGISEVPADIAKRVEQLIIGSVDPKCTSDLAIRLCEVFPIEFYTLSNTIVNLTGRGQMPGKLQPSGQVPKSEPVSPSDMPEGASSTS